MCRPAARELVTQGNETRPRPGSNAGRHCYFVGIRVEATAPLTSAIERTPFAGLQLGQMLGKGAYGRVYKGYYHGKVVAVKVHLSDFRRRVASMESSCKNASAIICLNVTIRS